MTTARFSSAPRDHLFFGTVFLLSGAAALIYEVTWVRLFSVVFGNSTHAISTVLAVFMGGLAVGSYLFGRWTDRVREPLRLYGLIELGIAATAFLVPHALRWAEPLFVALYQEEIPPLVPLTMLRAALAVGILSLPTVLMGGTLPVLSRCFVHRLGHLGGRIGFLYGMNTLGAVCGCALAGFLLIRYVGVAASSYVACAINVAIGVAALFLARPSGAVTEVTDEPRPAAPQSPAQPSGLLSAVLLLAFFVSGFTALSYEIIWTRVLSFVFRSGMSSYAFTLMLSLFLLGISVGSLVYSRWLSRYASQVRLLGILEILIGLSVPCCLVFLLAASRAPSGPVGGASFPGMVFQAGLVVLLPTLLFGMAFPLACRLTTGSISGLGHSLGRAYALNTIGAVLGPLATGFLLIPTLGSETSLKAMVAANLLLGAGFLLLEHGRRPVVDSVLVLSVPCAVILLFLVRSGIVLGVLNHEQEPVVFFEEGPATSVLVTRAGEEVKLNVGGTVGAGTLLRFRGTTELLAHGPLALHSDPRRVAVIGFGTGRTAGFFARHPGIERVDVVEISDSVFHIGRKLFGSYNQQVLDDPKTTAVLDDGFNFLKYTGNRYDIVSLDPFTPHTPGSARLYSRDCLEHVRDRLEPGGIAILWALPRWTRWRSFLTALKTFHLVFPHSTVWLTPGREYLVFLGTPGKLEIDVGGFEAHLAARPELPGSDAYVIRDATDMLRCFFLDEDAVRRIVASEDCPVFTVEHPVLEFLIHTDDSDPLTRAWIRQAQSPILPHLENVPEDVAATLRLIDTEGVREERRSEWVDPEGRFVWIGGEAVFRFGRHTGRSLGEVLEIDPQYLRWIDTQDFSEEVRSLVRNALEGRLPEREERP